MTRHTPLVPVLGRQRQEDLCDLEASLVYRVSARTARAKDKLSQNQKKKRNKETKGKKIAWHVEYSFNPCTQEAKVSRSF